MELHISDLQSYSRCAASYGYKRAGLSERGNSALAYGSVVHAVIEGLERARAEGGSFQQVVEDAVTSFLFFWQPQNIEAICPPVPADGWLPRRSYGELRQRGVDAIRGYAELIRHDDREMLALEYGFAVPIEGTWDDDLGEPHVLRGTVDQLAVSHYLRRPVVDTRDLKTVVNKPEYLRLHVQFTGYSYASTRPEYWLGWRGEDGFGPDRGAQLFERFQGSGRRATWIDLHKIKFHDAGWRGPIDFRRLALAADEFARAVKAEIFPLSISGDTCKWCAFRQVCGGGLPDADHGNPSKA